MSGNVCVINTSAAIPFAPSSEVRFIQFKLPGLDNRHAIGCVGQYRMADHHHRLKDGFVRKFECLEIFLAESSSSNILTTRSQSSKGNLTSFHHWRGRSCQTFLHRLQRRLPSPVFQNSRDRQNGQKRCWFLKHFPNTYFFAADSLRTAFS